MLESLRTLGLLDVVDMAVVAVLLWLSMLLLRRTRARMALLGLAILGGVYLVARVVGLRVTAGILQGFFAVFVVVVVVVFQEDLRRFFEQIAAFGLRRRPRTLRPGVTEVLVRSAAQLAASRTGALIVLPGREDVERHVEGGIALGGRLSEPLLLSLFDTSSPGHDGAVLLRGNRVDRFAVHLPLSTDHAQLGPGGTRHAAGLGLAERTDALCIVVSEERGTISVAQGGRLRVLRGAEELAGELARFLHGGSEEPSQALSVRLRGVWRETALSVALAFTLWIVFVPGSTLIEISETVPVSVENLPPGWVLESVEPPEVQARIAGRRRDVYLANRGKLRLRLDALLVELGRRTFEVEPGQLDLPPSLTVVELNPEQVKLSVRRAEPESSSSPPQAPPEPR